MSKGLQELFFALEIKRQEAAWAKSFLVYYHWFYKYISGLYEGDLDFLIKAIKIKSYRYSFEPSWSDTGHIFLLLSSEIEFVLFGTRDWNCRGVSFNTPLTASPNISW